MRRALTFALVLAAVAPTRLVWADEDEAADDEGSDEEEAAPKSKEAPEEEAEEEEVDEDAGLRPKQNLTGHDDGTNKRSNEFERDRFYTPAEALIGIKGGITRIRGEFYDYHGIKLMPTFHPAYLLRDATKKREVWEDMKKVRELLKGS